MKTLSLFVLLLTFVFANVNVADAKTPQSEALEIAKAGGLKKIRDVSRKDVEKAVRKRPSPASGALAGMAAGEATGVFSPPPGVSAGTSAGILAASAFLTSLPATQPEREARFYVWLPKELAADALGAIALFTQTLLKAVSEALPDYKVELVDLPPHPRMGPRKAIQLTGSACSPCVLSSAIFEGGSPRQERAPARLGGHDAYVWGAFNGYGVGKFDGFPIDMQVGENSLRVDALKRISERLPPWIYIYLPPHEKFLSYPVMIHQGQELLFLEPGLDQ